MAPALAGGFLTTRPLGSLVFQHFDQYVCKVSCFCYLEFIELLGCQIKDFSPIWGVVSHYLFFLCLFVRFLFHLYAWWSLTIENLVDLSSNMLFFCLPAQICCWAPSVNSAFQFQNSNFILLCNLFLLSFSISLSHCHHTSNSVSMVFLWFFKRVCDSCFEILVSLVQQLNSLRGSFYWLFLTPCELYFLCMYFFACFIIFC